MGRPRSTPGKTPLLFRLTVRRTAGNRLLEAMGRRTAVSARVVNGGGVVQAAGYISSETISRVERGRFEPAMTTVVAIASALGVSIDGLVGSGQPDQLPQAPKSPLAGRLVTVASMLDDSTQAALLAFVEQLAKRDRRRRAAKSQL